MVWGLGLMTSDYWHTIFGHRIVERRGLFAFSFRLFRLQLHAERSHKESEEIGHCPDVLLEDGQSVELEQGHVSVLAVLGTFAYSAHHNVFAGSNAIFPFVQDAVQHIDAHARLNKNVSVRSKHDLA